MSTSSSVARLQSELRQLERDPPPGVACYPVDESDLRELEATIDGSADTPYAGGTFTLRLSVPTRYPLEPPRVRFVTPVYHPNIDAGGRICLDTLLMPPKGAWTPALSLASLLTTVRVLLGAPNADDGLVLEVTDEYRRDYEQFAATARRWTAKYATGKDTTGHQSSIELNDASDANTSLKLEEKGETPSNETKKNAFDDDDSGADEESFDVQNEIQQTADVVENDAAEDDDSKQTEQKNKRARTKI